MQGYARLCKAMQGYARICKAMQGYARLCNAMKGYARLCKAMQCYARLCKLCVTVQYLRRMNLLGIWQIQNVEQVRPVSIPTLPAPETFNFFFKNTIYCKKLKICMRPWIRRFSISDVYPSKIEPLVTYIKSIESSR